MAMPKYFSIQSKCNCKYLSYNKDTANKYYSYVQFTGETSVTPYTKFQVEESTIWPGLVHIRCCYNNRYLRRLSKKELWIVAANDLPEEDKTNFWYCTLFKIEYVDDKTVRLLHVQSGNYACFWPTLEPPYNALLAGSPQKDCNSHDLMNVVDWEKMDVLPRQFISLKGDNGKYLGIRRMEGEKPYLQYSTVEEGDPAAAFEVINTPDGNIRIKSVYTDKYWRRNAADNWIIADADDEMIKDNKDCLFSPVKFESGVMAFKSVGNNCACKRYSASGKTDCLAAMGTSDPNLLQAEKPSHNVMSYLVKSMEIYDLKFNLNEASILSREVEKIATGEGENTGKNVTEVIVNLMYTEKKKSLWTDNSTAKAGREVNLKSLIPVVKGNKVELSALEFNGTYVWGKDQEAANEVNVAYKVNVPPMSKVTVTLTATVSMIEVPFSYKENDVLTSGQEMVYAEDGGMYSCSGNSNYNYTVVTKKL